MAALLLWPKLFEGQVCPQGRPAKNGRGYGIAYGNDSGNGRGYGYYHGDGDGNGGSE